MLFVNAPNRHELSKYSSFSVATHWMQCERLLNGLRSGDDTVWWVVEHQDKGKKINFRKHKQTAEKSENKYGQKLAYKKKYILMKITCWITLTHSPATHHSPEKEEEKRQQTNEMSLPNGTNGTVDRFFNGGLGGLEQLQPFTFNRNASEMQDGVKNT